MIVLACGAQFLCKLSVELIARRRMRAVQNLWAKDLINTFKISMRALREGL